MLRREFLAAAAGAVAKAAAPSRPNILFLMADQFRADALGVSGNDFVRTPSLDSLARAGVRFSNAYCPQALCTPSRGALLTGVYPHTNHLDHNLYKVANAFQMPEFNLQPNLPTLLRQAGYSTGYIGKWHLGEANPDMFDYWNGYNSLVSHWTGKRYESEYRSDVETEDAMKFLEQNRARSFALMVSYYPPHTPYDPPRKFEALYAGREHAAYYGAVTAVDRDIGILLDKLRALKLDANTLVLFTSDHGETFGLRLGSKNKTVSYEESAKVPWLVRWPGHVPAGIEYSGGVCTIDLMPTILEAAGIPIPERCQGHGRLEEMRRRQTGWKGPVFLENITQAEVDGKFAIERAVRTENWKLILRDHPQSELYDLSVDPREQRDVFGKSPARVKELARLILEWGEKTKDPIAIELARKAIG